MAQVFFAIVNKDGLITSFGQCPDDHMVAQQPVDPSDKVVQIDADAFAAGRISLTSGAAFAWFLNDTTASRRTVMSVQMSTSTIIADGVSECVVTGLPDPCTLTISGAVSWGPGPVSGGTVTLTSTTVGMINLSVTGTVSQLPWTGAVRAT